MLWSNAEVIDMVAVWQADGLTWVYDPDQCVMSYINEEGERTQDYENVESLIEACDIIYQETGGDVALPEDCVWSSPYDIEGYLDD